MPGSRRRRSHALQSSEIKLKIPSQCRVHARPWHSYDRQNWSSHSEWEMVYERGGTQPVEEPRARRLTPPGRPVLEKALFHTQPGKREFQAKIVPGRERGQFKL